MADDHPDVVKASKKAVNKVNRAKAHLAALSDEQLKELGLTRQ